MSPLKRSTDSIFSRQVVSSEAVATADAATDGKRNTCLQNIGNGVERDCQSPLPPSVAVHGEVQGEGRVGLEICEIRRLRRF